MLTTTERLNMTVRVSATGEVTRGIEVPHKAANVKDGGNRIFASRPHSAKGSRWRKDAGIPRDVMLPDGRHTHILSVTLPHDCRNHIRGFESETAYIARKALETT